MAILQLTVQEAIGEDVGGNPHVITWQAAGANFADKMKFPNTGKELILMRTTTGGGDTIRIYSTPDEEGREVGAVGVGYVIATIAATEVAMYGPLPTKGWRITTAGVDKGQTKLLASSALVQVAIIRLP
jgi:hypothetical protein